MGRSKDPQNRTHKSDTRQVDGSWIKSLRTSKKIGSCVLAMRQAIYLSDLILKEGKGD